MAQYLPNTSIMSTWTEVAVDVKQFSFMKNVMGLSIAEQIIMQILKGKKHELKN